MVSAQDYRKLTPLHELDASFSNTVKHVQTETVMGEMPARYAVRLAEVIVGRQRSVARPTSAVGADLAPAIPVMATDLKAAGISIYLEQVKRDGNLLDPLWPQGQEIFQWQRTSSYRQTSYSH
jgi:hypothetical protein